MRVIILLGGNAFASADGQLTMAGQFRYARSTLAELRPLLSDGNQVLLTHGNGPQVGHILVRVEEALGKAYALPLEVCVAESEGELGYVIEQSLHNLMVQWGCSRPIATLLTQVVVDSEDQAFKHPTKPIGPTYSCEQADLLKHEGFAIRECSGGGFRRVVPSPKPLEIIETDVIERLLEAGVLVVAAGGGGIPVVRTASGLQGVEAVVDKDLASALLGDLLDADLLLAITGVPCAYKNFESANRQPIGIITVTEARQLLSEGHFPAGSMGPKIEAALEFVRSPNRRAIICDAGSVAAALRGEAGTIIGLN